MGSIHEEVAEKALTAVSDTGLRASVGRLFADAQELVDAGDVTVVVLAARRLACLYQLLVRAGMPRLERCQVVSDRFLDADPSRVVRSAHVLVLDDSVVVGTTLGRLSDELVAEFGAKSVRCMSVCVDREQRADFLLESLRFKALNSLPSDEVHRFSHEVVLAMFEHQVPFFSDFPTTVPLDVKTEDWTTYLEAPGWHLADVTAPLLGNQRQHALAQVPTEETIERLLSRVPPAAASLVDSFKVRLYSHDQDGSSSVVMVPIAMLAACHPAVLDEALEAIVQELRTSDGRVTGIDWRGWKPAAKHRLVQLYLSVCVLAEVWPRLRIPLTPAVLEAEPIGLYFGDAAEAVLQAFSVVVESYRSTEPGHYPQPTRLRIDKPSPSPLLQNDDLEEILWETQEMLADIGMPAEPSPGELTKIGLVFAHAVSSVFGFLNRQYEIPERQRIAALPSRAAYDEQFPDPSSRFLNQGLTMRELTSSLLPESVTGSPWTRSIVSLGVDSGNDLGIIVPATRYDEHRDLVYRYYRLGETAQLAEWPLPRSMNDNDGPEPDALTRSVETGFPILAVTMPIHGTDPEETPGGPSSLSQLRMIVHQAVPGRLISWFEGTVTSVEERLFEADLITPLGDDQRVAVMSRDQIATADQSRLKLGAPFTWSVFINERAGRRDKTSRIRLRNPPPLDSQQLYRSLEALAELAGDDEPAG